MVRLSLLLVLAAILVVGSAFEGSHPCSGLRDAHHPCLTRNASSADDQVLLESGENSPISVEEFKVIADYHPDSPLHPPALSNSVFSLWCYASPLAASLSFPPTHL